MRQEQKRQRQNILEKYPNLTFRPEPIGGYYPVDQDPNADFDFKNCQSRLKPSSGENAASRKEVMEKCQQKE